MPRPSYERILPLISREELRGGTVHVTFQCPITGVGVQSAAAVEQGGRMARMLGGLQGRAASQLRWGLANMVRSALGGGYLGRAGSAMVHEAVGSHTPASQPSRAARQAAVLRAFQQVQGQFLWSAGHGGYLHVSAEPDQQNGFTRTLTGLRVTAPHDRQVAARMLAEIAAADGHIADEERVLIEAFTGGELGGIEQLLEYPPLTPAELYPVTPAVREPLLMMAYAVAFADQVLEPGEQRRLLELARGLRLGPAQVQRAAELAREHVMEELLDQLWADGRVDEAERVRLYEVGYALALRPEQIHAIETRAWQRRVGGA